MRHVRFERCSPTYAKSFPKMSARHKNLEKFRKHKALFVGEFNGEELFDERTGEPDYKLLKIDCPHCISTMRPLADGKLKCVESGWRWIYENSEPVYSYIATCTSCSKQYKFSVYYPQ